MPPQTYICASCRHTLRNIRARAASTSAANVSARTMADSSTRPAPRAISNTPILASHIFTDPPTPAQLHYSADFFQHPLAPPRFLLSTPNFRTLPPSSIPEVAFLGRSNVGKSSLLNALLARTRKGKSLAFTSSKPGRTRALTAFAVGDEIRVKEKGKAGHKGDSGESLYESWAGRSSVVVLDMPGYGKGSQEAWGTEVLKYIGVRGVLRRTFVLIDAEHGLKNNDTDLLAMLRSEGIAHQIILTKVDKILFPRKVTQAAFDNNLPRLSELAEAVRAEAMPRDQKGLKAHGDVLMCSSDTTWPVSTNRKLGIDEVRWAVLQAVGLESDSAGRRRVIDMTVADTEGEAAEKDPWTLQ